MEHDEENKNLRIHNVPYYNSDIRRREQGFIKLRDISPYDYSKKNVLDIKTEMRSQCQI